MYKDLNASNDVKGPIIYQLDQNQHIQRVMKNSHEHR